MDIPLNCIGADNPVKVVKHLDPCFRIKTRSEWLVFPDQLAMHHRELDRRMLKGNTLPGRIRPVFFPADGDKQ
jgi:hypothetical protein